MKKILNRVGMEVALYLMFCGDYHAAKGSHQIKMAQQRYKGLRRQAFNKQEPTS